MPTAKLKKIRKRAHEALEALFPRSERGVSCGPRAADRHVSKQEFRRVAMRSPAEVLEHLQD